MGLREVVADSVIQDTFRVRLRSLTRLVQDGVGARSAAGRDETAAEWQALLDSGAVKNRATLARQLGLSRARVTQVLGSGQDAGQIKVPQRLSLEPACS